MKNFNLKNKLLTLAIMLIGFCVIVGFIGYKSGSNITSTYRKIEVKNMPNISSLYESFGSMRSARIYIVQLALPNQTPETIKDIRSRITNALSDYDKSVKEYTSIPFISGEEEMYTQVKEMADNLKEDFTKAMALQEKSEGKENLSMDEFRKLINKDIMDDNMSYQAAFFKLMNFQKEDITKNSQLAMLASQNGTKWSFISIISAILLGGLLAFFIMKNIIAEQKLTEQAMEEALKNFNMVEKSSISTIMASSNGTITYLNEKAKMLLTQWQDIIKIPVNELIGKDFSFLYQNPSEHLLPITVPVVIGSETLELKITAIHDKHNHYIGPMLTWEVITNKMNLIHDLAKSSTDLSSAATNLLTLSANLRDSSSQTLEVTKKADSASENVNFSIQSVSTNMEEMAASIKEISRTTNETSNKTNNMLTMAKHTNQLINKLGDSSKDIGHVSTVIAEIAHQTNLLALNATIEAARAGELGKGFAVVANEVKELSKQTANATNEITKKIEAIQKDAQNAIEAIANMSKEIDLVNSFTGNIAAAVEEQAATTNEVAKIIAQTSSDMNKITTNINQVFEATNSISKNIIDSQSATKDVEETSKLLNDYVDKLKAS